MTTQFSDSGVFSVFPVPVESGHDEPVQSNGSALSQRPVTGLSAALWAGQQQIIRFGWIVLGLTVVVFLGYIGLGRIEGTLVTTGQVRPDSTRHSVQHPKGGRIRLIRIHEGQSVQAGELLIELDDGEHPPRQTDLKSPPTEDSALLLARRQILNSQIHVLEQQQLEIHSEASALERQLAEERRTLTLRQQELNTLLRTTTEPGDSERSQQINRLRSTVADDAIRVAAHEGDLARAHQRINELSLRTLALRHESNETTPREQRNRGARWLEPAQRSHPSAEAQEHGPIRAPVAGVVSGLRPMAPGDTVPPDQTLLEIQPPDTPQVIEARLRLEDVRLIQAGQTAQVRLMASPQSSPQVVSGRVRQITADSSAESQGQQRGYRIEVELSPQALRQAGVPMLQAGTAAELHLRTQSRTIAHYLIESLIEVLDRSMPRS